MAGLAMRMQFYAIEIARYVARLVVVNAASLTAQRNRAGLNDWIYEREHPSDATAKT